MAISYNNLLFQAVHGFVAKKNREPEVIILHPLTWQNTLKQNLPASYLLNDPKWHGIKVIRSLDVKEDMVEVH